MHEAYIQVNDMDRMHLNVLNQGEIYIYITNSREVNDYY